MGGGGPVLGPGAGRSRGWFVDKQHVCELTLNYGNEHGGQQRNGRAFLSFTHVLHALCGRDAQCIANPCIVCQGPCGMIADSESFYSLRTDEEAASNVH